MARTLEGGEPGLNSLLVLIFFSLLLRTGTRVQMRVGVLYYLGLVTNWDATG